MTAQAANLLLDTRDDVLWVRINRPDSRNALNLATLSKLGAAFEEHASQSHLKAAVLSGEGSEAFAAGGDLKELNALRDPDEVKAFFDLANAALDKIREFPVPTVAALNGRALGGGAELALACDYRVSMPHASIGYIHGTLNICCGFGGGADLMRLIGPARAMQFGLGADVLDAASALSAGLVDQVANAGESLTACALRLLAPTLKRTPEVIRAYKAMGIAHRQGFEPHKRRQLEREWFVRTWTSPDHWSAVEALGRARRERAS